MNSTFLNEDVTILLKDISGLIEPLATNEREVKIQKGVHYSEMLPLEYEPSSKYLEEYYFALHNFSKITADAVCEVADLIYNKKGNETVLVSLARAGTPIGILIKRYLKHKYNINVPHYTISIIRGKGIDNNAMKHILKKHKPETLQFVDGWTGKGAILRELQKEIAKYSNVDSTLAVIADPAYVTNLCGTHNDILIASSCLNSTICGLISRTVLRKDIIGCDDFHGAVFYSNLEKFDRTYEFINNIERNFNYEKKPAKQYDSIKKSGLDEVKKIASSFNIVDINMIKPGIGETTRVLLRRLPHVILVKENSDPLYISHILKLAKEKSVPVKKYPLDIYSACGIIKNVSADA